MVWCSTAVTSVRRARTTAPDTPSLFSGRPPRSAGPRRNSMDGAHFRRVVWTYYRKYGRHNLPWRKTKDPYKILVSEIMLQQTQVERVLPFYKKFIKKFSTAKKFAQASFSEVLKAWQGLGYNRRAKMLHTAAKELSTGRSDLPEFLR